MFDIQTKPEDLQSKAGWEENTVIMDVNDPDILSHHITDFISCRVTIYSIENKFVAY